ncbi:MAG: RluA family pseudouridine synthase [Solirubrobacteraceae bacterium]|nr:RluA family pseudouridine synthase [Solirubrobacteraceae bacterium]
MSVEELVVDEERAGERLDVLIAAICGSRSRAQRLIADGEVLVDGAPATKRTIPGAGQRITVRVTEPARDPRPLRSDAPPPVVRYEDEHLLVVDKPAGLVVHRGAGHDGPTLVDGLAGHLHAAAPPGGDPDRPGIVHRLDRDTSGLLLVARDDATHRALQDAIRERAVGREYLALVHGHPDARTGTIDAAIGRDRHVRTRQSLDTDTPRRAVTHFEIVEMPAATTLLRVRLETGRTHQIRVHLKAIGLPIVGDPEYGRGPAGEPQDDELGLTRQFLHAARLSFTHPVTGVEHVVESPLPDVLAAALEVARGAR